VLGDRFFIAPSTRGGFISNRNMLALSVPGRHPIPQRDRRWLSRALRISCR
jgi:hypothetical protein